MINLRIWRLIRILNSWWKTHGQGKWFTGQYTVISIDIQWFISSLIFYLGLVFHCKKVSSDALQTWKSIVRKWPWEFSIKHRGKVTKQTLLLYHPVLFFFLFLRSCAEPHRQDTMTCASGGVNSSLLYAKPQSSARGSRAHLQQDMFSFTPDRNTMPIYSHISCQPLDGSVTFQDDTPIRYVSHTDMKPTEPPQMKNPSHVSELLTDS